MAVTSSDVFTPGNWGVLSPDGRQQYDSAMQAAGYTASGPVDYESPNPPTYYASGGNAGTASIATATAAPAPSSGGGLTTLIWILGAAAVALVFFPKLLR